MNGQAGESMMRRGSPLPRDSFRRIRGDSRIGSAGWSPADPAPACHLSQEFIWHEAD